MVEKQTDARAERSARRRWTLFILTFFAGQAVLWTYALNRVASDPSHAVVDNYDDIALNWDEHRARQNASAALGWDASVQMRSAPSGSATLQVEIADREKAAVTADRVLATVFHQSAAANKQTVELLPTGPGVYAATFDATRDGKWRVAIDARKGDANFLKTEVTEFSATRGAL